MDPIRHRDPGDEHRPVRIERATPSRASRRYEAAEALSCTFQPSHLLSDPLDSGQCWCFGCGRLVIPTVRPF